LSLCTKTDPAFLSLYFAKNSDNYEEIRDISTQFIILTKNFPIGLKKYHSFLT